MMTRSGKGPVTARATSPPSTYRPTRTTLQVQTFFKFGVQTGHIRTSCRPAAVSGALLLAANVGLDIVVELASLIRRQSSNTVVDREAASSAARIARKIVSTNSFQSCQSKQVHLAYVKNSHSSLLTMTDDRLSPLGTGPRYSPR